MKLSLPIPSGKNLAAYTAAVLFIIAYAGGIWYVHHLKSAVRERASELSLQAAHEASLRNLGGFLEEVSGDAKKLSSFFVSPEAAVSVIEQIEGLREHAGVPVTISNVEIADKNEQTGEGTMVIDITSRGSWKAMDDLAALLDTFPFASRVDAMTLSSGGADGASSQWQLRATMRLWLRR